MLLSTILKNENKHRTESGLFGMQECKKSIASKRDLYGQSLEEQLAEYVDRANSEKGFNKSMVLACWEMLQEEPEGVHVETVYDEKAKASKAEAVWRYKADGPDRLQVTRNGEKKTVRVKEDFDCVYKLRKTFIGAKDGAQGIVDFLDENTRHDLMTSLNDKVLNHAFYECKSI